MYDKKMAYRYEQEIKRFNEQAAEIRNTEDLQTLRDHASTLATELANIYRALAAQQGALEEVVKAFKVVGKAARGPVIY